MQKLLLIILSIVLLILFTGPQNAAASPQPQQEISPLFSESGSDGQPRNNRPDAGEVIRSRQVDLNSVVLKDFVQERSAGRFPAVEAFVLNLFEDVSYVASIHAIKALSGGSISLVGRVASTGYSEVVMVMRGDILHAYVQDGPRAFEIHYNGASHTITEVDPAAYPTSLDPLSAPPPETIQAPAGDLTAADSASQIDVLAVYTPAARAASGGVSAIETRIQASIESTNEGYTNSGVTQQVNLVGMEEVLYTEDIPGIPDTPEGYWAEWIAAIERLTFGYYSEPPVNDASNAIFLPDARAYREAYNADLVFMVTALPYTYCGLGWIAGDSGADEYGYSVVHYNCTGASSYTIQHEMGHNMGACHDRANSSFPCMYDYSYGYQQPDQFYTVMAYSDGCGSCFRINRWSNPDLTYFGYPTGVAVTKPNSAHNALTLNNTAYNVANYRQSKAPPTITGTFTLPDSERQAMIPRTYLDVTASSTEGSITSVTYHAYYDSNWHLLHTDNNPADGWRYLWPTIDISPQTVALWAKIEDSTGKEKSIFLYSVELNTMFGFGNGYETRGSEQIIEEETDQPAAVQPLAVEQPPAEETTPPEVGAQAAPAPAAIPAPLVWYKLAHRILLK